MTQLLTELDDVAEAIVYTMIVAALKADATLAATIDPTSWTTYLEDNAAIANRPLDHRSLPAIRLTPYGTPTQAVPRTQVQQDSPFGITAVLVTEGHDVRDILNFWGAFKAAIFTGDGAKALCNSIRAALAAAGLARGRNVGSLSTINLVSPAIADGVDPNGQPYMSAEGAIVAMMLVPK